MPAFGPVRAEVTAPPSLWAGWRNIFIIEASGLRTTLAAIVPLIVGQIMGQPGVGMLAAVGGLQVAFSDKEGAKARTLLWATLSSAAFAFMGVMASQFPEPPAIALMFFIAFTMAMLRSFGEVTGNVGFICTITYALAQSVPVPWHRGFEYLWTFVVGGIWSSLLTLLLWRLRRTLGDRTVGQAATPLADDDGDEEPLPETGDGWYRQLRPASPIFKHAVRVGLATATAVTICREWLPPHGYWIVLTTLVILKHDYTTTKGRFAQRLLGTIVGGLLAMIPAAYIHNLALLDGLLLVFGVLAFSHLPRNYGLYVMFLTPFVVLISTIAAPADARVAIERITETILGGVLAFVIASLLRQPRQRYKIGAT